MPTERHRLAVRPAAEEDLGELQALARRTIDTCYRDFLGDEAVDWFIHSGASDAHVERREKARDAVASRASPSHTAASAIGRLLSTASA